MGSCFSEPATKQDFDTPTYKPSQWPTKESKPKPGPYHTVPAMHSYPAQGYPPAAPSGYVAPAHSYPDHAGYAQQYPRMAPAQSYPGHYPSAYGPLPTVGYPGYPPQVAAMPPQGHCQQQQQQGRYGQYGRPGGGGIGGVTMMGGGMGLLGGLLIADAMTPDCHGGDGGGGDMGGDMGGGEWF